VADKNFQVSKNVRGEWNFDEFERVRTSSGISTLFHERGEDWVDRLNAELHAAQAKRKQPVEDGYEYYVNQGGTRTRMYVVAITARAQAHERAHSSILKLMETTKHDVKTRRQLTKRAAAKKAAKTRRRRRDLGQMSDEEFRSHLGQHAAKGASRAAKGASRAALSDTRGRF
jgi:hypothetical protein